MEYQHTNAIPEEHNSSKPAHIPPNKDGKKDAGEICN